MQLTETVTIINKSGKVITNGKHIVNIFKEAKAAYSERKAAIKAERAAAADPRPAVRKAHTFGPESYYQDGNAHEQQRSLTQRSQTQYTHSRYLHDDGLGDRPRSVDGNDDLEPCSETSSRRSYASSFKSRPMARTTHRSSAAPSAHPPAPLSESNLRALTEVSATAPSQAPSASTAVFRAPYTETMAMSRPALVHANTAPMLDRSMSDLTLREDTKQKKKDIDMHLAYGNVPPDLATRTDLGPVTLAEEEDARWREEMKKEEDARKLMGRIDTLLDEAHCVHYTATSIIDHLQQKPEAAAAVALLLAELSTLLKTMSPGFLGIIKGGSPAIFALLASPQFLIGVGVAVGVTVIFFGGWKIVKRMKEAKAREANAQAFEMLEQPSMSGLQSDFQAGASYGPSGPHDAISYASHDDALVLDLDEELSTIESWRRGITPSDEDEESVDLELITPSAVKSMRGDTMSIRTTKTHRSSKSHRSHRSHKANGELVDIPCRMSSRAQSSRAAAADAESEAGKSERSHRSSRSKTAAVRTKLTHAIEDGSHQENDTVDAVLRPTERKASMLKSLFKKKKDKEQGRESVLSVMA